MNNEFLSTSLKFTTVDSITEKKITVTLNDLTPVRQVLQSVVDEPIGTTQAFVT